MWKIIFPKKLYESLNKFLFSKVPDENGCFLLSNHYQTTSKDHTIIVKELIEPDKHSWNYKNKHGIEPSSAFINEAASRADASNLGLLFVHTHPSLNFPNMFSSIDLKSNRRLLKNLSEILPDRPLGSLVFSHAGIYGEVLYNEKTFSISTFKIVGSTISEKNGHEDNLGLNAKKLYDRQIRVIGENNQKRLQALNVAVVGIGGTGSAVCVQLARMGVGRLSLIDKDVIDEANLPRVYGATPDDIGKAKVDVLKNHIKTFSRTKVIAIKADITKDNILKNLIDSDIIFSCTDNLTSRAILNDVSIQYFVPLIDIGCRIALNKDKSIDQAVIRVQVVTPDNACLWCTGTLDGNLILQESYTNEEKDKLSREGYYEDVREQPSIISITTLAASVGVNKLLALLGIFGNDYCTETKIEIINKFVKNSTPIIKDNCVCKERRGIGDARKIISFTKAS